MPGLLSLIFRPILTQQKTPGIPEKAFNTLTDEQKRRVEAAKTPEELLTLAKESGYELTLEDINKVSGGSFNCPHCQYDACPDKEVESPSW